MRELALVREAGVRGNLRQGEVASGLQELLGPLDAARNDVLVRRQPGGRLEPPREVAGAEMGRCRHLLQGQGGFEVLLDVLDDGAELPLRERTVRPTSRRPGRGGVANQVDGEQGGQGLGGETAPGGAGRELVIDRQHRGPQLRELQTVQRRQRHARGVEIELLRGDPCDQFRLQEDVKGVRVTAPAPPGRTAGRYHQDRAGGGRDDAADPFVARLELLRRMKKEEERVVRQGRLESLIGGLVAVAQRLQAHPPSLVARRARLAREKSPAAPLPLVTRESELPARTHPIGHPRWKPPGAPNRRGRGRAAERRPGHVRPVQGFGGLNAPSAGTFPLLLNARWISSFIGCVGFNTCAAVSPPRTGSVRSSRPTWTSTEAWSQYRCSCATLSPSNCTMTTNGSSTRLPVGGMPGRSQSMQIEWVKRATSSSTTRSCPMVRETVIISMSGGICDRKWFA